MSDFPSISNLMQKNDDDDSKPKTEEQRESSTNKFKIKMHEIDLKQKEELVKQKASKLGLSQIDLSSFPISHEALKVISEEVSNEKRIICFFYNSEEIRLGCVEYTKEIEEFAHQLGESHNANPVVYLISQYSFEKAVALYKNLPKIKPVSKDINITDEQIDSFQAKVNDFRDLSEHFKSVSTTDFLTLLIAAALKVEASDVHVEAEENGIAVRYRIDGVLQDVALLPKKQ